MQAALRAESDRTAAAVAACEAAEQRAAELEARLRLAGSDEGAAALRVRATFYVRKLIDATIRRQLS